MMKQTRVTDKSAIDFYSRKLNSNKIHQIKFNSPEVFCMRHRKVMGALQSPKGIQVNL